MKIKQIIFVIALLIGISGLFLNHAVYADCGGVKTSIINCDQKGGTCSDGSSPVDGACQNGAIYTAPKVEDTGIWGILLLVINILTAGIGIAAVGGVVYGSILYASSADDPGQLKNAKGIIINVVIGLVAYALMFSFLNFIIPGGLFAQ